MNINIYEMIKIRFKHITLKLIFQIMVVYMNSSFNIILFLLAYVFLTIMN